MSEIDDLLRSLADGAGDYERQGGMVIFGRHGREYSFELVERPGAGLAVPISQPEGDPLYVPIASYVQREILGLPRLAGQIAKTLERSWANRPGRFIEGPADCVTGTTTVAWEEPGRRLPELLAGGEPDTTSLIQLMAPAGQGKTALLEHVALELARRYQPDPYPTPVLLPVDLLGRYVGTVEDAIAGSLNNTYLFPGLSQRDVVVALRRRWLVLALDGFDELVARIGVRESFMRITELLDQLRGGGTVVLSARESFFELYRITAAIRTYLQPRHGTYSTSVVKLLHWQWRQGLEMFRQCGSSDAERDLRELLAAFDGDESIVLHPFFLTRLAVLWVKGERFLGASDKATHLARSQYIIETFIQREATEKWTDRDGNSLLSLSGHTAMLGGVAEEMWRSGAFKVTKDELELSGELGLAELELPATQLEEIRARLPTHGALVARQDAWSFAHDRFLHFFLAMRLRELVGRGALQSVKELLSVRELAPAVIDWILVEGAPDRDRASRLVQMMNELVSEGAAGALGSNAGQLVARFLEASSADAPLAAEKHTFVGDVLSGRRYIGVKFRQCNLWQADLSGTVCEDCFFFECNFSEVRLSNGTRLDGSEVVGGIVSSLDLNGERHLFAPQEIEAKLEQLGARIIVAAPPQIKMPVSQPVVPEEVSRCVERLVRASEKSTDVDVSELEEEFEDIGRFIVRTGIATEVMREVSKPLAGPRRRLVRLRADRQRLLKGQAGSTGIPEIDHFWSQVVQKYRRAK